MRGFISSIYPCLTSWYTSFFPPSLHAHSIVGATRSFSLDITTSIDFRANSTLLAEIPHITNGVGLGPFPWVLSMFTEVVFYEGVINSLLDQGNIPLPCIMYS